MLFNMKILICLAMLLALPVLSACSSSGQSDFGVAKMADLNKPVQPNSGAGAPTLQSSWNTSTDSLTNEEIVTLFTACLRDNGFDVPDPEVYFDGTVKIPAVRVDAHDDETNQRLEGCIPLLQGATFAGAPSIQDEIEFQDDLLELTQCLRNNGLEVADPDFSNGPSMSFFEGVDLEKDKVQKIMDVCSKGSSASFGSTGR